MPLFESVEQIFYMSASDAKGLPPSSASFVTGSGSAFFTFPNGDGNFLLPLSQSAYIINLGQQIVGEGIKPGTLKLQEPSAGTSASIFDDEYGRLYVSGSDGVASLVGNVFYNVGVSVITRLTSLPTNEIIGTGGMIFDSGSTLQADFSSSQTIHEYQLVATMAPGEFNYSINPSATGEGAFLNAGYATTGSRLDIKEAKIADLMLSGTLSPYITSIGFYNSDNQLLAVAKLPNPIERAKKTHQTIIVRFDV